MSSPHAILTSPTTDLFGKFPAAGTLSPQPIISAVCPRLARSGDDGQWFLANAFVEQVASVLITWVLDWAAELER